MSAPLEDEEALLDLVPMGKMLSTSYKLGKRLYIEHVRQLVRDAAKISEEDADALIQDRLQNWRHQKAFVHFFLKFLEQPTGLRERLCQVIGALSLTDDDSDFAEKLWKISRLLDDLPFESIRSLYVFATKYTEQIRLGDGFALRRMEYLPTGWPESQENPPEEGHRYYRIIAIDGPEERDWKDEDATDWFQSEDRMVDLLLLHLGTRATGFDASSTHAMRGNKIGRFTSSVDETVALLKRVLDLAGVDSLTW
jgi:hypothetical protein